jgi:hypothetical protein
MCIEKRILYRACGCGTVVTRYEPCRTYGQDQQKRGFFTKMFGKAADNCGHIQERKNVTDGNQCPSCRKKAVYDHGARSRGTKENIKVLQGTAVRHNGSDWTSMKESDLRDRGVKKGDDAGPHRRPGKLMRAEWYVPGPPPPVPTGWSTTSRSRTEPSRPSLGPLPPSAAKVRNKDKLPDVTSRSRPARAGESSSRPPKTTDYSSSSRSQYKPTPSRGAVGILDEFFEENVAGSGYRPDSLYTSKSTGYGTGSGEYRPNPMFSSKSSPATSSSRSKPTSVPSTTASSSFSSRLARESSESRAAVKAAVSAAKPKYNPPAVFAGGSSSSSFASMGSDRSSLGGPLREVTRGVVAGGTVPRGRVGTTARSKPATTFSAMGVPKPPVETKRDPDRLRKREGLTGLSKPLGKRDGLLGFSKPLSHSKTPSGSSSAFPKSSVRPSTSAASIKSFACAESRALERGEIDAPSRTKPNVTYRGAMYPDKNKFNRGWKVT